VLALGGISLFAALALGSVYTETKDDSGFENCKKSKRAINEVIPGFKR
jgi:hypothetical protein